MTRDEQDILDHLRFYGWSTTLDLCAGIVVSHIRVTAALRSLSRRGEVTQDGPYWRLQGVDAGPVPNGAPKPAPPPPEATQAQPVAPLPPRPVKVAKPAPKPKPKPPPKPAKRKAGDVAAVEADPDLGKIPDGEMARRHGVHEQSARRARRAHNLPPACIGRPLRLMAEHRAMVAAAVAAGAMDRPAIMRATGLGVHQVCAALQANVQDGRVVRVDRGIYRAGGGA